MTKKDKNTYLIPMEVTRETIKAYGIKKEDVVPAKIGNKIVSAIMIPTEDEKLYLTYMRPIWADMKREERSRRCMVSDGKGRLKHCEIDCKNCERMKEGAALSLDSFYEENAFEFEDPAANQCEIILTAMLFEDLLESLRNKAPELAPIFEMLYDGKSQRTIANLINKPQSSVNYMVKRMRTILQQHINRDDLAK